MKLKFVFIHGTAGWGSYDKRYEKMPYWGMRGGDLISYLNENGLRKQPQQSLRTLLWRHDRENVRGTDGARG